MTMIEISSDFIKSFSPKFEFTSSLLCLFSINVPLGEQLYYQNGNCCLGIFDNGEIWLAYSRFRGGKVSMILLFHGKLTRFHCHGFRKIQKISFNFFWDSMSSLEGLNTKSWFSYIITFQKFKSLIFGSYIN